MLGNTPSYYPIDSDTRHHLSITIPKSRFKRNNPHYYRTHERIRIVHQLKAASGQLIMHLDVVALH